MSVSTSVRIEGMEEMKKKFAQSPHIVGKELEKATRDAGKAILSKAKKEAPIKTGGLRRSIDLRYKPISVSVFTNKDYAIPVHEGSRAHIILPRRAKVLRFKTQSGKVVYTKRVRHPGYKGNPFMERAVDRIKGTVEKIFEKASRNITRKLK